MASRWSEQEEECLDHLRVALAEQTDLKLPQKPYPDVVGDRRMLRFIRGHKFNMPKVIEKYSNFLKWRAENNVDRIRDDILYGGYKSIFDFPGAKDILKLVPQIVVAHDALDKYGNPISYEDFSFDPELVVKNVTKEQYTIFMIYMLEYRMLVLEQMSHEREKRQNEQTSNLDKNSASDKTDNSSDTQATGVILQCMTIRNFSGFSLAHLGSNGKTVLKWILELATENYPETLFRSHMVKVPFVFNTAWFFIKGLLDQNTVGKVRISGSDYLQRMQADISIDSIPECMGGKYKGYNTFFKFDLSAEGPFNCAGQAPTESVSNPTNRYEAVGGELDKFAKEVSGDASGGRHLNNRSTETLNTTADDMSDETNSLLQYAPSGASNTVDSVGLDAGSSVASTTQTDCKHMQRRKLYPNGKISDIDGPSVMIIATSSKNMRTPPSNQRASQRERRRRELSGHSSHSDTPTNDKPKGLKQKCKCVKPMFECAIM